MKIAMFSENFYPELSGITDSIIDSTKELVKRGHEVDIYAPRYSAKDFATYNVPHVELDLGTRVRIYRFPSVRYPAPTGQGRMVFPTFLRWRALRQNRPDIIHTHLFFGVGMEALAASWFLKVPLVGTSHTPMGEFMRYSPVNFNWLTKLILNFVSWYYNRCDFVTAPSKYILNEMKGYGFRKPSQQLSNPIDLRSFFPATQEEKRNLKTKFGLSDYTVLYTGRLATEKHIDVILRAVALAKEKIPMVMLAITGSGTAELSLKKLAEELKINDRVRFFGTLLSSDHEKIYRASDVFAIASTAETQSISMLKAMATGIPVIGVDAGGLPEYINQNNGYMVKSGAYADMAEKIIFLFEHPEQRKMLGSGGLKLTSSVAPARVIGELERIYRKTIDDYSGQ